MSEGRWTKVGVVAGVVAATAGCLALLPLVLPDGAATPAPQSASVATSPAEPTRKGDTSLRPGECVLEDASAVACSQAASRLVVAVPDCSVDALRSTLGVPAVLQVNLRVAAVGDVCTALPGEAAVIQGATGETVLGLRGEVVPALLVDCAADSGETVTCATPHRVEPVSAWSADELTTDSCSEKVRAYVNRSGGLGDPLTAEVQRGSRDGADVSRCVVRSGEVLVGSVYNLGGRRLPTG